jgi:hypothetical protein
MHTIEGESVRVDNDAQAFQAQSLVGDPDPAITVTDEKLVKIFVKIRDAKRDFAAAYKTQLEEQFDKPLRQVSTELKRRLESRTNQGLKTEYGTVYLAEEMKVSCQDWGIFYDWIKNNDALDFLEQRVKVGEVKTYMEKHSGELPPGLSVFRELEARVRKPTKRGEAAVDSTPE